MDGESVNILLVEDDDVDVEVVKRGFRQHKIGNPVTVAQDGVEALEILRGQNGRQTLPKPYLILLDLNMPRMNGIELLKELRSDPELNDTVVFVLTTSRSEEDMVKAYREHIAGYMVKADVGSSFRSAIDMLTRYWTVVVLPR